jgi:A/G-specific adenine glycosylase
MQPYTNLLPIVEPLLDWYDQNKRSLPWRVNPSPYHVWISEIMLQQTRIEAVIPYYERFLNACPTVEALATIDDDKLMKLWEGLGYYSRARNLKRAAIVMMQQHGGNLPADYRALLSLPGIGPYTAGAIASIAFGLPEPAVDGNVLRVVTRLTADESDVTKESTKQHITALLRTIYPQSEAGPGAMTQALMELGERICLPNGAPRCQECPLGAFCPARAQDLTDRIPNRPPKKARSVQEKTVLVLLDGDKVALRKRPDRGLLASLWEFVSLEGHLNDDAVEQYLKECGIEAVQIQQIPDAIHIFTHVEWHMKGYLVLCGNVDPSSSFCWATRRQLQEAYALPTAYSAQLHALEQFWDGET